MDNLLILLKKKPDALAEGQVYELDFSLLSQLDSDDDAYLYSVTIGNTLLTVESSSELEQKVGCIKINEISKGDIETVLILEPYSVDDEYFTVWSDILSAVSAKDKEAYTACRKGIEALFGSMTKKDVIAAKEMARTGGTLLTDLLNYDRLIASISSIKESLNERKDESISAIESIKDMPADEIYKIYDGLKDYFNDLLNLSNTQAKVLTLLGSLNTKSSKVGLMPEQLFESIKGNSGKIKLIEDNEKMKLVSYEVAELLSYLRRNYNPNEMLKIDNVVQATEDDLAEIIRLKAEGLLKLDKKVPKSMNLYVNPKIIWAYNLLRDESNYNIGLFQVEYQDSLAYKALSGKNVKLRKIAVIIPDWFPTTVEYNIPAMINPIGKNYADSGNDVYFGISDTKKSDFSVKGHPKWERLGKTKEGQILFKYKRAK